MLEGRLESLSTSLDSVRGYKPISDYGVIGDMHTAALVGLDGSIDWYCAPRFDSPSVFAALLDSQKGGRFQLSPTGKFTTKQSYEGETNVLATTFDSQEGRIKLTDFMPCFMEKGELKGFHELHRIVDCLEGDPGLESPFNHVSTMLAEIRSYEKLEMDVWRGIKDIISV